ncbi:TetR/AcrR family transcriptional regulator [Nocardia spumae]|uniref:TetR/AcrR family transcriptional regulator n=1 Tax=Nocardia spumae TaxID=2887190 RepID=UPI001D13C29D|nr:TetR/AcrR family transcriptional regulator [Nocardia spumae]
MPSELTGELRADARSNRDQILLTALEVFAERGTDVPMKYLADRAGVGVGTLYRRFPDRDTLVIATARAHLNRLAELAESALAEEPTAWDALCRFLRECLILRLGALADAIEPAVHTMVRADPRVGEVRTRVTDALAAMVERAQRDADLRRDVDADTIGLLLTTRLHIQPGESGEAAVDRVLPILVDGLRGPSTVD